MQLTVVDNVVCPGCTCLCDDLRVRLDGRSVAELENGCPLARRWFQLASEELGNGDSLADRSPVCVINGQPGELDNAVDRAAEMLRASQYALVGALDGASMAVQQIAWQIARQIGGSINSTLHHAGRSRLFAMQQHGLVAATLGEIAHRSDVALFWFCDPMTTHPRLLQRISRPAGRAIIVVDEQLNMTAKLADKFIGLAAENGASAIWTLRGLLAGLPMDENLIRRQTGHDIADWVGIVDQLASADYATIFSGSGHGTAEFDLSIDGLHRLIRQLNQRTHCVGYALRNDNNALAAENILTLSSGFPCAVNHNRAQPRFHYLEYSAERILSRGDCDAALLLSARAINRLSQSARQHLQSIRSIIFTDTEVPLRDCGDNAIWFQVGRLGWSQAGQVVRQDDVVLPLNRLVPNTALSLADVLTRIGDRLAAGQ